jgi:Cytochrome c3/Doubled CXXCH motif (Paired_CXXCH_1)
MEGKRLATIVMVAFFSAAMAFFLGQGTAQAAGNALSAADQQCLACHSVQGFEKKLANGETLSLYVQGPAFAGSVHNMIGCNGCHTDITLENHPPLKTKIVSVRENQLALTKVCRSCHADIFKRYEGSIHAALVREGNPSAPVCSDCHNPHAVNAKAEYDTATGTPCSKCHDPIFKAYAVSVHAQAGLGCASCHHAHDVSVASTGDRLKNECLGCHQDVLAAHQKWLPNAAQHFDTVSCAACHAPGAKLKVDLRLYDNAGQRRLVEKLGVPQFQSRARLADAEHGGLDAMALRSLLQGFNEEGIKMTLRGRLEASTGPGAHRLMDKSQAIRNCATCHQHGASPFQSVTVSIVGPDGRPVRYGAKHEVLSSMISVDSIGGFYAIGGTRIKLLDWLLGLALLGGIGGPLVHLTINWYFKRYAQRISGKEDS